MLTRTERTLREARIRHALVAAALPVVIAAACGDDKPTPPAPAAQLTYWKDVAPVVNAKCTGCHQMGGIGPFALDSYADLKQRAPLAAAVLKAGTMPPFLVTHDGSCGNFEDQDALSAPQRATLLAWLESEMKEGTPVTLPKMPRRGLTGGRDYATPLIAPVAPGGQLGEFDEYRCFLLDPGLEKDAFVTASDVIPGTPKIVHHVAVSVVDPDAASYTPGKTNGEVMAALDAADPDRIGWHCIALAGDRVIPSGQPVIWAPGQQPVVYPEGMGMRVRKTDKLVVQMHFNLFDPANRGLTDTTTIRLRWADSVQRQLISTVRDGLVEKGLREGKFLPPGEKATSFPWKSSLKDMGVQGVPYADLIAVMPHMHERGVSSEMKIGPGPDQPKSCVARVERWNFHWQRIYFYKTPMRLEPQSEMDLNCVYDTSGDQKPILPGWGTGNEMCTAILFMALPPAP